MLKRKGTRMSRKTRTGIAAASALGIAAALVAAPMAAHADEVTVDADVDLFGGSGALADVDLGLTSESGDVLDGIVDADGGANVTVDLVGSGGGLDPALDVDLGGTVVDVLGGAGAGETGATIVIPGSSADALGGGLVDVGTGADADATVDVLGVPVTAEVELGAFGDSRVLPLATALAADVCANIAIGTTAATCGATAGGPGGDGTDGGDGDGTPGASGGDGSGDLAPAAAARSVFTADGLALTGAATAGLGALAAALLAAGAFAMRRRAAAAHGVDDSELEPTD